MKRFAGVLLAVSVLGASACGSPPPPRNGAGGALEAEALKVVARYDDAWMRKDLKAVTQILAPEYVYFSSKGDTSDLAATKAMLSSPGYRLERGRRDQLKAYRYGSTVVVSSHWTGAGVFDGRPFTDDQRCSVAVGFSDAVARVLSEHCTQIP